LGVCLFHLGGRLPCVLLTMCCYRALKFRYHIALPPWPFDAKSVGTEADGWEVMLEGALMQWVERVVEERRSD
jgi:hypothetical protein